MVIIEFGKAEQLTLDKNSLFIRFAGPDFKENVARIKGYWNRKYLAPTKEWEVPFSCWEEIKQLYADTYIQYLNEPPKANGGMPCGACREFFLQLSDKNKDMEILTDYENRKTVKLIDLMPGWWGWKRYKK